MTVNGSKGINEQTLLNTLLMTNLDPDKALVKFWQGDADNAPQGTVNCTSSSSTNLPYDIDYWFFLTTHYHSYTPNYAWQMAAMMTGGDSVYIRIKNNGVWEGWICLTSDKDTGWVSVNPIMRYRIRSNLCTIKITGAYISSYIFNLPFQPISPFATQLFWGSKVQGYMSITPEGNVTINDVAENENIYCDFTFPVN